MTKPESIAALFKKGADTYGRLDVLFNNAGMGAPPVNFGDLSLEQWQGVGNTNLTRPFLCTQHSFRNMKALTPRGGRIIHYRPRPSQRQRALPVASTSTQTTLP